jgi:hypothetical protein
MCGIEEIVVFLEEFIKSFILIVKAVELSLSKSVFEERKCFEQDSEHCATKRVDICAINQIA